MKVQIRLKQWKQDNVRRTWDQIIDATPPYYRNGVSHEKMSIAFLNGGSFIVDFQGSIEQAQNFMKKLVVAGPNTFDIGTAP
jgi:hypothetical protein